MIRILGRRCAYVIMFVVVGWYVLFSRRVRASCRPYLSRRFPGRTGALQRLLDSYRRVCWLGRTLVDRAAFGILGPHCLQITFPEGQQLVELIDEGAGVVLVNSHVGCWQVAMAAFLNIDVPVSIVMHRAPGDLDQHYFEHQSADSPVQIIDPAGPMGGIMEMIEALRSKHLLGLMGDRIFGDDENTVEVDFLGARVHFPVAPYRLASMQGSPVAVVFSHKSSFSEYGLRLARVIRVPAGLGRDNEAYRPYIEEFARALEEYCQSHPFQFFNFHDMWELGESA
ncbi:MAG: lipid A biosynthesis acyltransferase [Lentisphaeria bacterium]|nr:lipid A biosynthesis acyltransferase [Lentisphaeria bacterium]